jgi:hypothetical protein
MKDQFFGRIAHGGRSVVLSDPRRDSIRIERWDGKFRRLNPAPNSPANCADSVCTIRSPQAARFSFSLPTNPIADLPIEQRQP